MRQNITASKNKNPEDVVDSSSLEGAHVEDDFVKLDLSIEHIEFDATGEMPEELIEDLESAKAKLYKTPCLPSVRVGDVPDLGAVDLCHYRHGRL